MPIYSYTCTTCNEVVEKRQSFTDPPLTTCAQCGGTLRKIIHPVGIVFKGSGWYVNDSRSSKVSTNGSNESDSGSSSSKDSASKDAGPAKESSSAKEGSSAKESAGAAKESSSSKESSSAKDSGSTSSSAKPSNASSQKS